MKNRISGILWGIAFIIAGVGFAGDAFGIWNFELFFDGWWTLFIIVPCLISLFQNGFRTSTLLFLGVGVLLLLAAQDIIDQALLGKLLVPAALILIGIRILFRNPRRWASKQAESSSGESNRFCDCWAVLGGREETFTGWLGGANLTSILGSAELRVPQNVRVHVNVTPILGGVDNRANEIVGGEVPTIYVNGLCIMGGLDIK